MSHTSKYTKQFKARIVKCVAGGASVTAMSKKHSLSTSVISLWCKQAGVKTKHVWAVGKRDGDAGAQGAGENAAPAIDSCAAAVAYLNEHCLTSQKAAQYCGLDMVAFIKFVENGEGPEFHTLQYSVNGIKFFDKSALDAWKQKRDERVKNVGADIPNSHKTFYNLLPHLVGAKDAARLAGISVSALKMRELEGDGRFSPMRYTLFGQNHKLYDARLMLEYAAEYGANNYSPLQNHNSHG